MAIKETGQGVNVGATELPSNVDAALTLKDPEGHTYIQIDTDTDDRKIIISAENNADGSTGADWVFNSDGKFTPAASGTAYLNTEDPSATNPNIGPNKGDADTGIGQGGGVDSLSLIAGAVEGIRITEAGSVASTQINGPTNIKIADTNVTAESSCDDFTIEGTGATGMSFLTPNNVAACIGFKSENGSAVDKNVMLIQGLYNSANEAVGKFRLMSGASADNYLEFETNGVQRVKIDATGATTISGKALVKGDLLDEMTGTVSIAGGALTVLIGSGTDFDAEIYEGSAVKVDGQIFSIVAVASDTSATLDSAASGAVSAGTKIYTDNSPLFQVQSGDSRSLLEANNNYVRINGRGGPSDDSPQNAEVALYIDSGKPVSGNTDSVGLEINAVGSNGPQILMSVEGSYMGRIMAQSSKLYIGTQYASQDVVLYPGSRKILTIRGDEYAAVLQNSDLKLFQNEASTAGQEISFYKSRNTTDEDASTVVNDDDILGEIKFHGANGNGAAVANFSEGARIYAKVNGTPGNDDMPTELIFATTPDGTEAAATRLSISHNGIAATTTDTASCFSFGRTGSGDKFEIRSSSGTELNILGTHSLRFTQSYKQVAELDGETLELKSENYASAGASGGLWTDLSDTTATSSSTGNRTIACDDHDLVVGQAVALPSGDDNVYEVFSVASVTDNNIFVVDSDLSNSITNALGNTDGYKLKVLTGDGATLFAVKGNGAIEAGLVAGTNRNVGIGDSGMFSALTTGQKNVFIGHDTGDKVVAGNNNTCVGFKAGEEIAGGNDNVFIGQQAGNSVTGYNNTGIGSGSMGGNGTTHSVAVGQSAMSNVTGVKNVAVGAESLNEAGAAANCVASGYQALTATTNSNNTGVGYRAGAGLTSGQTCTFLGADAGHGSTATADNQMALGYGAASHGANVVTIGNASVTSIDSHSDRTCDLGTTSYEYDAVHCVSVTEVSDERLKESITDSVMGLDFINSLRPVSYKFKDIERETKTVTHTEERTVIGDDGEETIETYNEEQEIVVHPGKTHTRKHQGLLAQEVKAALDAAGIDAADFGGYVDANVVDGVDKMALRYNQFIGPLIKSIQELTARVADLESDA